MINFVCWKRRRRVAATIFSQHRGNAALCSETKLFCASQYTHLHSGNVFFVFIAVGGRSGRLSAYKSTH